MQYKVKPKTLFLEEVERAEKNKVIEDLHLNHHKFRFIVLPLNFDFNAFVNQNIVVEKSYNLIIQYSGTRVAEIVNDMQEPLSIAS